MYSFTSMCVLRCHEREGVETPDAGCGETGKMSRIVTHDNPVSREKL